MSYLYNRRTFLKTSAALTAATAWPLRGVFAAGAAESLPLLAARKKQPALVRGAFFYPPAEVVEAGQCEDNWSQHKWFTWPGNQFAPADQQAKFMDRLRAMTADLDLTLAMDEESIYTDAAVAAFIAEIQNQATRPDALLLINFYNSFSRKIVPILDAYDGPIILYHAVGANHQLPPERFRTEPRLYYIHSIENFEALERGLRAVHARTRLAQSRLLRVSGRVQNQTDEQEPFFGTQVRSIPAEEYNSLFDETNCTPALERLGEQVRAGATEVRELSNKAFRDAVCAHAAVLEIMNRHEADAITIECLFLKHRKPCLSFAINNGALTPCGCENDLNATLTLMLGAGLFGRGGFQHNPEFDTEENRYFGAHCTCATKLHGPAGPDAPYLLRPFFHQPPKTLALDVQWPEGEPATLCKYHSDKKVLDAWRGRVVSSPKCPPTGGCATRVLVEIDGVDDVCSVYHGPHPVLFCGDFARHLEVFAQLYGLEIRTNA